ncbi:MAG: hypothetical protein WAL61_13400, partial [Acidimicrobiales bacterium]
MSAGPPPAAAAEGRGEAAATGDPYPAPEDRARAAEALREAFVRLAPQGGDAWNFLAAFTHLGDRYGPYHPGASALSDALEAGRGAARRPRLLDRIRPRRGAA